MHDTRTAKIQAGGGISKNIQFTYIEQSRNKLKVPVGSKIALHGNGDRNGALLQIVT
jgi:hypothetical protein